MNLAEKIIQAARVDPGVTALVLIDRCRELEAQLAESDLAHAHYAANMQSQLAKATDDLTVSASAINKQIKINQELRRQLAELEQDRERLEWYFNQRKYEVGPVGDGYGAWDVKGKRYPKLLFNEPFKTLRQAIDAARAANG